MENSKLSVLGDCHINSSLPVCVNTSHPQCVNTTVILSLLGDNSSIRGYTSPLFNLSCQQLNNAYNHLLPTYILHFRLICHYISLIICVMGVGCNFFLILALTRPYNKLPSNVLLTSLAVSDQILMLAYGIYVLYIR